MSCARLQDNVELPHPELSWVVNVEVAAEKMNAAVGAVLSQVLTNKDAQ